jgi:ATP-dependent helicase, dinG family
MELRSEQRKFVDYAAKRVKESKYCVCEMPTAFGKTFSALMLAKKLIDEKIAQRVVIATSDNSLAKSIFLEAKAVDNLPDYVLGIGKNNYLDIKKLAFFMDTEISSEVLPLDKEVVDEAIKKLKEDFSYVLIEDFLNELDIVDADKREYIANNLALEKSNSESFKEYTIQITNYSFLFSKFMFDEKYMEVDSTVYIFDEIQELPNMAEMTLSSAFSLYSYYLQLKTIAKTINDDAGAPKTLIKLLNEEVERVKSVNEIMSDEKMAGKTLTANDIAIQRATNVLSKLFDQEKSKALRAKLKSYYKKTPFFQLGVFLNKFDDVKSTLSSKDIYISFSQERGFISFHTYSKDIKLKLADKFWSKIDRFVGITATALLTQDVHDLEIYKRMGINFSDIKLGDTVIKERKSKICVIKSFEGILRPEQATYSITNNDFIEDEQKRFEYFADEILRGYDGKNTMVLVGGFDEVRLLAQKLESVKDRLVLAEQGRSVQNIIEGFKKSGGILIATRNYATGINLKGKTLERLFITKLPYPVYQTKKWILLKEKNPSFFWFEYNNEMVMTFRQAIGRLIRSPEDSGKIFLLDGKFNALSEGLKNRLIYFLEKIALKGAQL